MQTAALIKSYIYVVSSSLLYPVLILLAFLTFWAVVCGGALFSEWVRRHRIVRDTDGPDLFFKPDHALYTTPRVSRYVARLKGLLEKNGGASDLEVESLLQEATRRLFSSLDMYRLVVRVGPGLGLIGTLIPMGTGLAALGQGDLSMLSSELVIAFTTTVVGLAVGLLAYLFLVVKNRWADEDLLNMEVATEALAGSPQGPKANDATGASAGEAA
ncbi:MotA/TolQ/ExbB proton channel family protein [Desulfoluna spongiiphila]|uniref:MotA/TolQ/ExbB proton channel family protein n=1 Tax=Desulfoluna spongiiphila TaxID=419481 RepID=UPI001259F41C|nr:MotA/TolQ/ExbB proton channel family protein [Desulfoluna spongiiphila]VVS95645.1 mota/tolq/exbb proton channel [Desulfoluna spongiiphila]